MSIYDHILKKNIHEKWDDINLNTLEDYCQQEQMENIDNFHPILKDLLSGKNIFLTGAAGSGKSTFLKMLMHNLGEVKNLVTLAPTGVAALNVNGQTIHSFFKFKTTILTEDKIKKRRKTDGFKNIDLLIIDEISMVRADLFQAIDIFLRKNATDPTLPFGGIQILVIGDLYQLPPIVTGYEKSYFYSLYDSPFFFDTKAFWSGGFACHALLEIHRQKDPFFIKLLGRIRVGKIDDQILEYLKDRHISHFSAEEIAANSSTFLTARNDTAQQINADRLDYIDSEAFDYEGIIKGNFNLSEHRMPAPQSLTLKIGAKVMFTKNDGMGRWVNGSVGIVENLGPDFAYIRIENNVYYVETTKWEAITYEYNEESEEWGPQTAGTYEQLPLTLAWAITIHKSQGRTLDSCIVTLDGGAFADGQLYVALSRCRDYKRLYLCENITRRDIKTSRAVKTFYQSFLAVTTG